MIDFQVYWGWSQTYFIQSFWLLNWVHSMESSKKKAIPKSSQAVRNQVMAMIKKEKNWYLPSPPTLSISFYKGVNWKAALSLKTSVYEAVWSGADCDYTLSLSSDWWIYYVIFLDLVMSWVNYNNGWIIDF